tara:strand:- start:1668 stop:2177 length:510 start_codon:yes stop_codon:yes gene_type:complete
MKDINLLIKELEKKINNPKKGLPEEIFLFLTRISPVINVDLLIQNQKGETLLTWRKKGEKFLPGWHIPGGIIRFKEKVNKRLKLTALNELGCKLKFSKKPIAFNELHLKQKNRSHFISMLYKCKIIKGPKKKMKYKQGSPKPGQWKWFSKCPKDIIEPHKNYKDFFVYY